MLQRTPISEALDLRPYQHKAIDGLRGALRSGASRPVLQAPTGAGKTKIATAIVANALEKGRRVAFCVPAVSLIDQTLRAFHDDGIKDMGAQQGDHPMWRPHAPVQVCSIQTLEKRTLPEADVVIVDECHIQRDRIKRWMEECPDLPFIGLSATPWSRGLGTMYDALVVAARTRELIDQGFLSPFKVYAPSAPNMDGVRTQAGDWHSGDLAALARDDRALVGDVVATWRELAEDRPTVVFAVDRAHAAILQQQFEINGVAAAYIDCFTPRDKRDDIRIRFYSGTVKVVVNVDCLGIGVDWDVRCVVLARPHKSEMAYVQKVGRGLRTAEGKDHCLILDHSSTTMRLGFVDEIHHDTLDDGSPRKKSDVLPEVKVTTCSGCGLVVRRSVRTCPGCGAAMPVAPLETKARIDQGSLGLFDKASRAKATMEDKAVAYAGLRHYALARNYKEGWAANCYREMYGVWPNSFKGIAPRKPTDQLLKWIQARNIRRAKSTRRRT